MEPTFANISNFSRLTASIANTSEQTTPRTSHMVGLLIWKIQSKEPVIKVHDIMLERYGGYPCFERGIQYL